MTEPESLRGHPTNEPELSVVIPTLGNHEMLARVLEGYERQRGAPGSFEVVVAVDVADPQPEQVETVLGQQSFPARAVTASIAGASANRNAGCRAARAPIVLFTDNDTIPDRNLVEQHLAWHRRNPEDEVAVLGRVRWAREVRVTPFMRWLDEGIQFDYGSIDGIEATWAHLYSANCSLKLALFERVGGYDEERLPYGYEDIDLGYRARAQGLRVLYNRRAVVHHVRSDMTLDFWRRRIRRAAAAERRFVELHPDIRPHLYTLFSELPPYPPGTGRGARWARYVPRWIPWLGPRVWTAASLHWRQQLAPHFLEAWEEAGRTPARGPDLSERHVH